MALEKLKKAWEKRPGLRLSSKFSKWRKKQGEKKNRSQLKRYTARLEELRKIENPNDWQKNQIKNALKLKNEAAVRSGKTGMQDNQGDKGKGPKGNQVGSKPGNKPQPKVNTNKSDKSESSTNGDQTKETPKAVWNSEKFKYEIPKKTKPKEKPKSTPTPKTKTQPNKEKVKVEKKPEKKDDGGRAEWLKKTRNSPAAKSGAFSDDERWKLQQKHRKWKASRGKK